MKFGRLFFLQTTKCSSENTVFAKIYYRHGLQNGKKRTLPPSLLSFKKNQEMPIRFVSPYDISKDRGTFRCLFQPYLIKCLY